MVRNAKRWRTKGVHYSIEISNTLFSGDETFLVDLKDIQVKPDPPKPGENMTVTVTGHVKQVIEVRAILYPF